MFRLYKNVKDEFYKRLLTFHDEGIKRVVLYGAGELSMLLMSSLDSAGFKVVGIVDSDPDRQGQSLLGIPINAPSEIEAMRVDAIIITSLSHREVIYKSIRHLEGNGIRIKEF